MEETVQFAELGKELGRRRILRTGRSKEVKVKMPLTTQKPGSGQDEEDIKSYIADLEEKERLVVHVRRVTEEVNFEKEEIIVICDSGSESENGDGIEMLRVMPTDIADVRVVTPVSVMPDAQSRRAANKGRTRTE
ncbi:hypothetical protein I315_00916 [Cryptococcus gattii Ru294]|nr:hypothetical protein I315_00916 [Cryptococcus gattii Ru294]